MSLSARAIALQGIGSAPRFVALQGLVPVDVPVAPTPIPAFLSGGAIGGATMTLDEWRRRRQQSGRVEVLEPETATAEAPRRSKRTRREREEELILILH